DLLEPVIDESLAALPPVQKLALESALARMEPPETFGRLSVSRAMLAVLRELALESPLVIAIDDVQWLDASTRAALEFALRRLSDVSITVLASRRGGESDGSAGTFTGIPLERVPIGPLTVEELGALVVDHLDEPLSRPRLVELHNITGGNPYFALEIVRALGMRGSSPSADSPFPIPEDIAALLRERIVGLSPAAFEVVLLVAASPQPTRALLVSVTGSSGGFEEA